MAFKLTNAYSDASPIAAVFHIKPKEDPEILLVTNDKRGALMKSSLIPEKSMVVWGFPRLCTAGAGYGQLS